MQLFFYAQQLLRFFFLDRSDGHARPAGNHVFDVFAIDNARRRLVEMIFLTQDSKVLPLFTFFVGVEPRLLELMVRNRVFHSMDDELEALLNFRDLFRQRSLTQLHARAGFIDEINSFIR